MVDKLAASIAAKAESGLIPEQINIGYMVTINSIPKPASWNKDNQDLSNLSKITNNK